MKKLFTLIAMFLIAGNVAFAAELGEDAAADCISTHQSGRYQEVLSDSDAASEQQSGQSTSR